MPTRRNRAPADALDDDIQPLGVSPATAQINQPRRRNPNNTGSRDIASRGRPATAQHTASTNQKKRKRPRDEITGPATDQETTTVDRTLRKPAEDRVSIGKMTCIICMEPYTNATMAAGCGHVYCHECLTRALIASEQHSDRSGHGNCPTCRKSIDRKKANAIVPINFMTKKHYDERQARAR